MTWLYYLKKFMYIFRYSVEYEKMSYMFIKFAIGKKIKITKKVLFFKETFINMQGNTNMMSVYIFKILNLSLL